MFKFMVVRDITNIDPKKRKKIQGIQIVIGRDCRSSCWCNKASQCCYGRKMYRFHNAMIDFRNWFYRKFKVHFPHWIYISSWSTDLSGTKKCPHHKPRRYTCWDCKHAYGMENCRIPWDKRKEYKDAEWPNGRCGSYEPDEFANDWDRRTGERTYGKHE